jgi:cyclopropane fatty-acyl-phospholipid synthase-like methyltransferase
MFTNHDVARYYDLSEVHYRLFWNLEKSRSLHYGIWDSNTRNFHEALLNTNRVLAEKAGIKKGDRVLDAGCGVGGSSIWLAKERGCVVTGISLNAKQVQKATVFAVEAGVSDKVKFEQNDYLNTGYPAESFDVIWGVESICYANDKSLFLKEAYRLLKKGGRLIMADFFKQPDLKGKDAEQLKAFANSWAINDFSIWEEFHQQLMDGGFENISCREDSKAIMPSVKRLYRAYLFGKPAAVLYRIFKGKPTSLASNNVESAYLQYATLKKGLWQYRIVKAEKQ